MDKGQIWYFSLIAIASIFCFACEEPAEEIAYSAADINVDVETTSDVELIYSDSAIVNVIVSAETMLTHTARGNQKQEFPNGVDVDFFAPNGRVQSELTCKDATRHEKDKRIIMRDSVVWKSGKGEILDTEELIWDERNQKVFTKRLVKITTEHDVIHGYGFEADQGFTKWKITSPQGQMGIEN